LIIKIKIIKLNQILKHIKILIPSEKEFDVNELRFLTTINKIDIDIGRMIVVWGKSDNFRITDILNPLDSSTIGITDIKDLRLGRGMSKISYSVNKWDIDAIILHENRYSKEPIQDYKMPQVRYQEEPKDSILSGGGLAFNGHFSSYDISFYFANTYLDYALTKI